MRLISCLDNYVTARARLLYPSLFPTLLPLLSHPPSLSPFSLSLPGVIACHLPFPLPPPINPPLPTSLPPSFPKSLYIIQLSYYSQGIIVQRRESRPIISDTGKPQEEEESLLTTLVSSTICHLVSFNFLTLKCSLLLSQ